MSYHDHARFFAHTNLHDLAKYVDAEGGAEFFKPSDENPAISWIMHGRTRSHFYSTRYFTRRGNAYPWQPFPELGYEVFATDEFEVLADSTPRSDNGPFTIMVRRLRERPRPHEEQCQRMHFFFIGFNNERGMRLEMQYLLKVLQWDDPGSYLNYRYGVY